MEIGSGIEPKIIEILVVFVKLVNTLQRTGKTRNVRITQESQLLHRRYTNFSQLAHAPRMEWNVKRQNRNCVRTLKLSENRRMCLCLYHCVEHVLGLRSCDELEWICSTLEEGMIACLYVCSCN